MSLIENSKIKIHCKNYIKEEILFIDSQTFRLWIEKVIQYEEVKYRVQLLTLDECKFTKEQIEERLCKDFTKLDECFEQAVYFLNEEKEVYLKEKRQFKGEVEPLFKPNTIKKSKKN